MRIIYSPNKSVDSVLKPFIIENEKIINKDIEYIAHNYALSLCGNYDKFLDQLDNSTTKTVVKIYIEYNKPDRMVEIILFQNGKLIA
jgi:hypothetical protein